MILVVALRVGSPEDEIKARECLDALQEDKVFAYRVGSLYRKIDIDFVAISGTEIARAASYDVG